MIPSDFRVSWRLIRREPGSWATSLLALSAAFATCFLLLAYVAYSFSSDTQVPDARRVVLFKFRPNISSQPRWLETAPLPFVDVATASKLVTAASAFVPYTVTLKQGGLVQSARLAIVHPAFADVMGLHATEGDLADALARPNAIALTQRAAHRLLGDRVVLPATVQVEGRDYSIVALLPDLPANSTLVYEGLVGTGSALWPADERARLLSSWGSIGGKIYARVASVNSLEPLDAALQEAADHSPLLSRLPAEMLGRLGARKAMEIRTESLPDVYFDADLAGGPGAGPHGDRRNVVGLAVVALLVLGLAVVNHVNLATTRTLRRQREIAIRKVLGAPEIGVAGQFLLESGVLASIAASIGLALGWALIPTFSDLVDRRLDASLSASVALGGLALGACVGLLAGLYPAWVALRAAPGQVLAGRGDVDTRASAWLRRTMTVIQFGAAIALTGATITLAWQTRFITQMSPGFDASPLLIVQMPDDLSDAGAAAFRDDVARLPGVTGVAAADAAIGDGDLGRTVNATGPGGRNASLRAVAVTREFFAVHGLQAAAGRVFDPAVDPPESADKVVLNPEAARALGFADPAAAVGQMIRLTGGHDELASPQVVGIAPPLRLQTLRTAAAPLVYRLSTQASILTVRVAGGASALGAVTVGIEEVWRRHYPNEVPRIDSARHLLLANYADDIRLSELFAGATLIALGIAAFGIHALSAASVQRRSKEIALRKLHGADGGAIAGVLGIEFGGLVALGAAIGAPIAFVVGSRYVAGYAEQAPVGGWAVVAALAIAAAIALIAVLRQLVAALNLAPADALRA